MQHENDLPVHVVSADGVKNDVHSSQPAAHWSARWLRTKLKLPKPDCTRIKALSYAEVTQLER
jgi:hypothetical protein